MRYRTLSLKSVLVLSFSMIALVGCSSNDEVTSDARQAAGAAAPQSGSAICLKNETSSSIDGTSVNTREVDRDVIIPSGETGCAWWVGASKPKLIVQGDYGPVFEVVRSGNFDITFCDQEIEIPWGTGNGSSEEITMDCVGNAYTVTYVKSVEGARTFHTAVVRDAP